MLLSGPAQVSCNVLLSNHEEAVQGWPGPVSAWRQHCDPDASEAPAQQL